jgi:hypothetical protein
LGDIITTWNSASSDPEVNSTSTEQKYEQEYIIEPCTDNSSSACVDNSISPEPISPALTGKTTALRAKAFQKTASSPKIYSIKQGETKRLGVTVGSGAKYLLVNLNWGDKTDALTLSGTTPSGSNLDTYGDNCDNSVDGKILFKIYPTSGTYMKQGQWVFKIYGKKVNGTEDFTFAVKQC